jgi:hypothetical protein
MNVPVREPSRRQHFSTHLTGALTPQTVRRGRCHQSLN